MPAQKLNPDLFHASILATPYLDDAILHWKLRRMPWLYHAMSSIVLPGVAETLSTLQHAKRSPKKQPEQIHSTHASNVKSPRSGEKLVFQGADPHPDSRLLCVMSTWDPQSWIDDYVVAILQQLAQSGFKVVVVNSSGAITADDLDRIKPFCNAIIVRHNEGHDFGSYKIGIEYFRSQSELLGSIGLLIMNDSIVGPFQSFPKVLEQLTQNTTALSGLNDSYSIDYHLQSFFLFIPHLLLQEPRFGQFWDNVDFSLSKKEIITSYEVGFSQLARELGYSLVPMFPISEILASARLLLSQLFGQHIVDHLMSRMAMTNPSVRYWSILIDKFDYPFVKRAVLVDGTSCLGMSHEPFDFLDCRDRIVPIIRAYTDRVRGFF